MMFQEITSRDIEMALPLFPDESASSQLKEIGTGEPEELDFRVLKELFFTFPLSEIVKIETLTSRYQPYEYKTETAVFVEKFYKRTQHLIKISKMIDKITQEERLFKGINKHKLLKDISEMLGDTSVELSEISDEELLERIKRILTLEVMSGILRDLNPEQATTFDEAVKRRTLFNDIRS